MIGIVSEADGRSPLGKTRPRCQRSPCMNTIQKNSTCPGSSRQGSFFAFFRYLPGEKSAAPLRLRKIQLVPDAPEFRKVQLSQAQPASSLQFHAQPPKFRAI